MRFREQNKCRVIISIVLMLLLVQPFSPHFHVAADSPDGHNHSHAHALDSGHPGDLGSDHDEVSATDPAAQSKQSGLFAGLVMLLTVLLLQRLPRLRYRSLLQALAPPAPLLRFRPPLRAPPL